MPNKPSFKIPQTDIASAISESISNKEPLELSASHKLNKILQVIPIGSSNPISSREISKKTGIGFHRTGQHVRNIINDLIVYHHVPIAADNRGFFIINNNVDFLRYKENLQRRINAMQAKIKCIEIAYKEKKEGIKE